MVQFPLSYIVDKMLKPKCPEKYGLRQTGPPPRLGLTMVTDSEAESTEEDREQQSRLIAEHVLFRKRLELMRLLDDRILLLIV